MWSSFETLVPKVRLISVAGLHQTERDVANLPIYPPCGLEQNLMKPMGILFARESKP